MIPRSQTRSAATMAAPRHAVPTKPSFNRRYRDRSGNVAQKTRATILTPNFALKNNNSGMPDQFLFVA